MSLYHYAEPIKTGEYREKTAEGRNKDRRQVRMRRLQEVA